LVPDGTDEHFQDLSKLGRKLDRVLMIDHDPVAFELQAFFTTWKFFQPLERDEILWNFGIFHYFV